MSAKKSPPIQTLNRVWMTVKQTADYLQFDVQAVRRYVKLGKLQASQIVPNGRIRISAESVKNLLETNKVESANG